MTKEEKAKYTKEYKASELGNKAYRRSIIFNVLICVILIVECVIEFCIKDNQAADYIADFLWLVLAISAYYDGLYYGGLNTYLKLKKQKE